MASPKKTPADSAAVVDEAQATLVVAAPPVPVAAPNDPPVSGAPTPSSSSAAPLSSPSAPMPASAAPPGNGALGSSVTHVTTPEAGVTVLKEKVSLLHKVVNDTGHFASLAFNDVEALLADIKYLATYIRSKV